MSTVRVSVMRCQPHQFAELKKMMAESIAVLGPGIRRMRGLIHFYAGEDEAVNSLVNVSVWHTVEDARQLDTFQPMLDLGKTFAAKGAIFERPAPKVMNSRDPRISQFRRQIFDKCVKYGMRRLPFTPRNEE